MERKDIKDILERVTSGTASPADEQAAQYWLHYLHRKDFPALSAEELNEESDAIYNALLNEHPVLKNKNVKFWPRVAGIAAAVIGLAVCVYFFTAPPRPDASLSSRANAKDLNDIAPGGNRATLTVNGRTTTLSDSKSGIVINNNDVKYNDGTKIDPSKLGMTNEVAGTLLTLTTPRGGVYQSTLPDGTKIWLNADSKLEFISNFWNKPQRVVKLIAGEAYFEVTKNKAKPFIVESNGQRTEVLGTHFNISAYPGEGIKTTLLEGSVRVASLAPAGRGAEGGERGITLKPNQQSLLTNNTITVKQVDAQLAIAWKNGNFMFEQEDIKSVMQKIARWYNIDVVYEGNTDHIMVGGTLSRFSNVSKVLAMLQETGAVKFRIENRTVYVSR